MENVAELVEDLFCKDNKTAYAALLALEAESEHSDAVYCFFDRFAGMIEDGNSYIRTRGLVLISANAKWDTKNKIEKVLDAYLMHILDEKPISARQCIKLLPNISKCKPELAERIRNALKSADPFIYNDNMQPLIIKDIAAALKEIG
jgi:hypothetical protein